MNKNFTIGSRKVGKDAPVFIVAEMSANHLQDYGRAMEIIHAAREAGADAVKLQTFTPDTITMDCEDTCFQITQGTIWDGTTLYSCIRRLIPPGTGSPG